MSHDRDAAIPIENWPGPVCRYRWDESERTVHDVDGDFRRVFGNVPADGSLADALRTAGFSPTGGDGGDLVPDERGIVQFTRDGADATIPVLVQNVSLAEAGAGVLLCTIVPDSPVDETDERWLDVDDVATVVSHDLRNPLDVAKARLRAGRERVDNEHFERVARAHERMERIIEDVLTLARGEATVDLDDRVDLGVVAEAVWETKGTTHATLVRDDDLPLVLGDEARLRRLFENLFRNAITHGATDDGDASETGRTEGDDVTVTVGAIHRHDEQGFFVADDGAGIAPGERSDIFRPGYTGTDLGTGLGLSISARIVELHGWSIDVTGSETGGARFEITGIETT